MKYALFTEKGIRYLNYNPVICNTINAFLLYGLTAETMILLNLLTTNQEQIDKIIHVLLTNNYATTVILGNPEKAYSMSAENALEHSIIYKLQFATKALLFSEIEASLAREFPHKEFYIYATPIVQTTTRFFDRIKNSVKALNVLNKKKNDNQ